MKKYDYGHLEEIEVRRDDQKLYTFKEGDFKRLRLQDIEDMLLLLVQQVDQSHNRRTDIDKKLYQRRLMQNLEKFIGGRESDKKQGKKGSKCNFLKNVMA
ncbi:hypothetical protein Tco_0621082 [Tanacetum coccineum]